MTAQLTPFPLEILSSEGDVLGTVTAWPTRVPGLVVNACHENDGDGWAVTHARSTSLVFIATGPEEAMHAAERLAADTGIDWTLPASEIIDQLRAIRFKPERYGRTTGKPMRPTHPRWSA